MSEKLKILQHLEEDYTEPIRDPIWKHIYLSPAFLKISALREFQELNKIKQLGPAYLVYPGATHTRLSHSLGTFHLAKRIILELVKKSEHNSFTLEGVKAFLCAALLHDLGHFPYAHSLKELSVENHECLTAKIIMGTGFKKVIKNTLQVEPVYVAAIVDESLNHKDRGLAIFRSLLSGVLDPDKLDYLNRDAYYCGVPYGIQDVDFVLHEIIAHHKQGLALTRKGITAVLSILFSKYLMYKTVYWHKTVRIATAMIKKALLLGLKQGVIKQQDLYSLTDEKFYNMFSNHSFAPFRLINAVWNRSLYKQVASIPFNPHNALHRKLENIEKRQEFESLIIKELKGITGRNIDIAALLIDIPERNSFELDLFIHDPDTGKFSLFKNTDSIFNDKVISGFTQSLRNLSLVSCRDADIMKALEKIGPRHLLEAGLS